MQQRSERLSPSTAEMTEMFPGGPACEPSPDTPAFLFSATAPRPPNLQLNIPPQAGPRRG